MFGDIYGDKYLSIIISLKDGSRGAGGLAPLIFQKRPINMYNFIKKLKIYISALLIFFLCSKHLTPPVPASLNLKFWLRPNQSPVKN
jgi:hypothetical protein